MAAEFTNVAAATEISAGITAAVVDDFFKAHHLQQYLLPIFKTIRW